MLIRGHDLKPIISFEIWRLFAVGVKLKREKKINGGFRLMKIMSAKVKDFLYFLKKYYITCKKTMKTLFFEILASEIHYI